MTLRPHAPAEAAPGLKRCHYTQYLGCVAYVFTGEAERDLNKPTSRSACGDFIVFSDSTEELTGNHYEKTT